MSEKQASTGSQEKAGLYEIRIAGHLDIQWADWFGEVVISLGEDGNTSIFCHVVDQAALHGLLKRVRDLGLPLLSINFVNPRQRDSEEVIR